MPMTLIDRATSHPLARPAVPRRVGLALLAVLAAWGVLGPPTEAARPCHVPGDFATIQAAVEEPSCAIINVAAGEYREQILIARPVTIRGAGQARTVISGGPDELGNRAPGPLVAVTGSLRQPSYAFGFVSGRSNWPNTKCCASSVPSGRRGWFV